MAFFAAFSGGTNPHVRALCSRSASLISEHPDVARHRDDHLADRLGLRAVAVLDLVELRDAVDQHRDFVAELRRQLVEAVVGVLDGVVQQGRGDRLRAEPQVGEDLRDRERVGDVRLAALPLLSVVGRVRDGVRALDDREVALGWCVRTVRMSCSTSSRRAEREKMRGTSRRSDEVCAGGTVSVIRSPPLRWTSHQSYARGSGPPAAQAGTSARSRAARTRSSRALTSGSLSRNSEYSGAATKSVEYAATIDADEDRQRDVGERLRAEPEHADEQDRPHREDRDDRRVDRADEGLVTARLTDSPKCAPDLAVLGGVLPDLVEHDGGVVQRVREDRQEADDGGRRDLEPDRA